MKKWIAGLLVGSAVTLLVLSNCFIKDSSQQSFLQSSFTVNASSTNPLEWIQSTASPSIHTQESSNQVISGDRLVSSLFLQQNFSDGMQNSLYTWNHMNHIVNNSQGLPNAIEAIKEAIVAWGNLTSSIVRRQIGEKNNTSVQKPKGMTCPNYVNKMDATNFDGTDYRLRIPCGLIQGSSITVIGIPNGLGNFRIDLAGEPIPGEPEPPIILHYNVRLLGDKTTEDPVIVQNTWTLNQDWGEEERCPSPASGTDKKVDDLKQCNDLVGKGESQKVGLNGTSKFSTWTRNTSGGKGYFPFKKGYLSVMTIRVGEEGIQMTVDGKHITSFAYRESLEPWLVSEIRISGDLKLVSVLASGLPTSEEIEHITDLEALRAVPLPSQRILNLFIGIFSTANNFKRRMAVRRSWMQYSAVRSGAVAVRFFVGLHKNQVVNEELWNEAQTYGDIQLMPFVDYYSLITLKTLAICIFGTQMVSAKYVMKTDDDAFVRVDEVLLSLNRANVTQGLLYGLINSDSSPHRDTKSKWYINLQEWPEHKYPPWAHGPGYVVSSDIAEEVFKKYRKGVLKMFKLEDVAMGIWVAEMKSEGIKVSYMKEERVFHEGCKDGYIVAHYQNPRELLCLWQKLQELHEPKCCGDS